MERFFEPCIDGHDTFTAIYPHILCPYHIAMSELSYHQLKEIPHQRRFHLPLS